MLSPQPVAWFSEALAEERCEARDSRMHGLQNCRTAVCLISWIVSALKWVSAVMNVRLAVIFLHASFWKGLRTWREASLQRLCSGYIIDRNAQACLLCHRARVSGLGGVVPMDLSDFTQRLSTPPMQACPAHLCIFLAAFTLLL